MVYEHYESISLEGIDTLVISLKVNDAFYSQKSGKQIFANGYEIRTKLRKQLPPPVKAMKKMSVVSTAPSFGKFFSTIDSEAYFAMAGRYATNFKISLAFLLAWTLFSGNKNIDFLWSWLGVVQLMSHISLLKIQMPMNTMLMSKALIQVSVLDIRELQHKLFNGSALLDTESYDDSNGVLTLIVTTSKQATSKALKAISAQITQYQLYEMEYREKLSFLDNLRSSKLYLFGILIFWIGTFLLFIYMRFFQQPTKNYWIWRAVLRRLWNYMGPNALIRLITIEYLLIIFAAYVTLQTQINLMREGQL